MASAPDCPAHNPDRVKKPRRVTPGELMNRVAKRQERQLEIAVKALKKIRAYSKAEDGFRQIADAALHAIEKVT